MRKLTNYLTPAALFLLACLAVGAPNSFADSKSTMMVPIDTTTDSDGDGTPDSMDPCPSDPTDSCGTTPQDLHPSPCEIAMGVTFVSAVAARAGGLTPAGWIAFGVSFMSGYVASRVCG